MDKYRLIDTGDGQKLEAFGKYTLIRPSPIAVWKKAFLWDSYCASFARIEDQKWAYDKKLPTSWQVDIEGIAFKVSLTDFGHVGIFPEHKFIWDILKKHTNKRDKILNLFAYTGGATLSAAKKGAEVVHLDSSKKAVQWAKENAALNHLENAPIRYIIDDVKKFLKKEINRGKKYDGIILDPPTFGRGTKNEVFKIEKDIFSLLEMCFSLLEKDAKFLIFTCHSPGFTPTVLSNLLSCFVSCKNLSSGEIILEAEKGPNMPAGSYAMYLKEGLC